MLFRSSREVFAGQRRPRCDEIGRGALEDDASAVVTGTRPEVDDPVGVRHHGLVVLDDDDALPAVDETVETLCEVCDGSGFSDTVLEFRLNGKNIAEVLAMSAAEAADFFPTGAVHTTLIRMIDVGLGYITLGQALTTLSGGERQRLKLAISMAKKGVIYVLDEPTTGLHLADVQAMLGLLDRLVDAGNSVIVIEHHQAVMAHADWIVDLGPGAGHDGGRVVFEGTPADLVARRATLTGDRKSTRLNSSHSGESRMPSSA